MTTNRAHVLLWTDNTAPYLDGIKAAGLADRVAVETVPRKEKPSSDQLANTEVLMATAVPAGVLPAMKKLRWAQAMSAGVDGWFALPDLPADLTLTCARGTHTESMPENIMAFFFFAFHTFFFFFFFFYQHSRALPPRARARHVTQQRAHHHVCRHARARTHCC